MGQPQSSNNNELLNLINFYQRELQANVYRYKLSLGIDLSFKIEPSQISHLIFGTISSFAKSSSYEGQKGYDNIVNGKILTVPYQLQSVFKTKSKGFKELPELLKHPTIYHFNKQIVLSGTGSIKGFTTKIDAEFLLHKDKTHLFIRYDYKRKIFVPVSIVYDKKDTYIQKQLQMMLEK